VRALIYVPIIHLEVDLGSMAGELKRRFEEAFGPDQWTRRYAAIEAMWEGLRAKLVALPLAWPRTRLYQDGLPVCGHERAIVADLAGKGSHNHRLLSELMERGATLMGTEDPELMVAEYRRIQKLLQAGQQHAPDQVIEALQREGEEILRGRDAFIARRIEETLAERETGILFIGLLHRVDELLDQGGRFEVRHLIHNLPFGADPWRNWKEREQ
jgi:hypothetical protein